MDGHMAWSNRRILQEVNLHATWNVKKARKQRFQPCDKVLMMLPWQGYSLNAKYCGPMTIEKIMNAVNYVMKTPEWRVT